MAARGMVEIERERCKGCLLCMEVCPRGLLGPDDEMNVKGYLPVRIIVAGENGKGCTGCAMCAAVCPEVAIEVYREI